ncbi:Helix-turn-helix domain-containing protein [Filimonas lacunae]|uniref:Helix-turn-helix domain-containing protein n=1 Tax=Filimonas lacunae TaxID=477680 RepID=A0A173MBA4_9BACT|nr:response regulator transcription factor [Filimonas lacunae]BAV04853.1 transcriptional regulator, AraC family [Filimonas lacunae]SIT34668.1 Helix-turn-helix domain-containing protein [Filimonas lacunae]
MADSIIKINNINKLHEVYACGKPQHPLISLIDLSALYPLPFGHDVTLQMDLYIISCKQFKGWFSYGRQPYDFAEGSLMFAAPGQVLRPGPEVQVEKGWGLFFHPDLINGTDLGRVIHQYSFFLYDVNEALHISDEEKQVLQDCIEKIKKEYSQNIDKHTHGLIVKNIELLLSYCDRFYDRQFLTRRNVNNDLVQRFEKLLRDYFAQDTLVETGQPEVKHIANQLNISPNYLSDLLKKYTGKTTQEHIHLQLTEKAKSLLLSTSKPVSEIAYELGFLHPSHFTKLFKSGTGLSPRDYRNKN